VTSYPSGGSGGRDLCECVGDGPGTASNHRRLPEASRNPYHPRSRGGPPRHGNFLDSVYARPRVVTCLCTEFSPSVRDEPSTPGESANCRSGPRSQQGESVAGSEAIALETGRAGRSCLEKTRLGGSGLYGARRSVRSSTRVNRADGKVQRHPSPESALERTDPSDPAACQLERHPSARRVVG